MDLPQLNAMTAYWAQYPPTHVMVAAYLGLLKPKAKPPDEMDFAQFMSTFSQTPGAAT